MLALIAFTGYGSSKPARRWLPARNLDKRYAAQVLAQNQRKVTLYKGGTDGGYNTGAEPYCEHYAAQVAAAMGIDAIPYGLSQ